MKPTLKYFAATSCALISLTTACLAPSARAQNAMRLPDSLRLQSGSAAKANAFDGGVSFVLPPGYRALSKAEIARKFSSTSAPQYVWAGDKNLSASIALTRDAMRVSPTELPLLVEPMRKSLEADKTLQWLGRETIEINGQSWIHFEFITKAVDTRIYNDLYFTSWNGQLLIFNFNATLDQRDRVAPLFHKCRDSIELQVAKG